MDEMPSGWARTFPLQLNYSPLLAGTRDSIFYCLILMPFSSLPLEGCNATLEGVKSEASVMRVDRANCISTARFVSSFGSGLGEGYDTPVLLTIPLDLDFCILLEIL